ncbi:MAG: alpha-amylase [Chloroflexia bacterium]|nr:alpha-amylase [Chloroflexia bacterium]
MESNVTQDFIFGTLATDALRLDALRAEARGITHLNQIDPLDPVPDQPVTLTVLTGPAIDVVRLLAAYTLDGTDPGPESEAVEFARAGTLWDTLLWGYREVWTANLPAQPACTLVRYTITATDPTGTTHSADPDPGASPTQARFFAYHVDDYQPPSWVDSAVIYHVFIDRFSLEGGESWRHQPTLNDFWGGTLRGVIERLPYLATLGIDCLWLSPLFPSPSHHGYDATDLFSVEPRLGTEADLRELIESAHTRGIRILLDFVANHISDQHPAFFAARTDQSAPTASWFTFQSWPDEYRSFFGVRSLPQLNLDYPVARQSMIAAATYWLELGVDGFRLDYANGPSHAFWAEFRAACRAVQPACFLAGEVVETASLQRSYLGRLDGTLDFLLLQQLRSFFAFDTIGPGEFDAFIRAHLDYFPTGFSLLSFLDNHDMNRFLWIVGGDTRRLKLAALFQFTLPHPPIIYYGTEAGLSQWHDLTYPDGSRRPEESRTPMLWDDAQETSIVAFYQRLIALRREFASLWTGARRPITLDESGFYVTQMEHDGTRGIVALNRTNEERVLPFAADLLLKLCLATDDTITFQDGRLTLPPLCGALLICRSVGIT